MTEKPRIYWDGYGLADPRTGIFVHAQSLAAELVKIGTIPALVGEESTRGLFPGLDLLVLPPRLPRILAKSKPLWPLRVGKAAAAASYGETHVVHGLSNFNIPWTGGPRNQRKVLTVHDLIPFIDPSSVSKAYAWQMQILFPRACAAADRIICISAWTRRVLAEKFPQAAHKCVTIANGSPKFAAGPARTPPLGRPVQLLTVGRLEPYKRLDYLAHILRRLPPHFAGTLVTNPAGEQFMRTGAQDLIAAKRLSVFSNVSREKLAALYMQSDVLVHPSRFEGFCLPVVEALAAGCSVVYQTGSAIDEIVSGRVAVALPVDASLNEWVQGVEEAGRLLQAADWTVQVRQHLAALPSWKDAANLVQNLYNDLTS